MKKFSYFTSESVTEGHPDKLCDQIADAILDAILEKDADARVACEVTASNGLIHIMGEITTSCYVDVDAVARGVIRDIGYNNPAFGFDADTCAIITSINSQSPDIAMGVNRDGDIGAGDQGMMFGYACNETLELMPFPISLAHKLAKRLAGVRKNKELGYLRPDGKTQVTVRYDEDGDFAGVDTVLISTQHDENVSQEQIRKDLIEYVIKPVLGNLFNSEIKIIINPTGRFVIGGPAADTGLTGRKIIVDTYGGYSRHGGGSFSGKCYTKVDRSAAYMARYAAKNIVAAGLAEKCEVQVSYAIGVSKPVSILVDTFGTGVLSDIELAEIVRKEFDFRPVAIIEKLGLKNPIYRQLAAYGHMGREDLGVAWERLDKVKDLQKYKV